MAWTTQSSSHSRLGLEQKLSGRVTNRAIAYCCWPEIYKSCVSESAALPAAGTQWQRVHGIQFDVQDKQKRKTAPSIGRQPAPHRMEGVSSSSFPGGTVSVVQDLGKNFGLAAANCNPIQAISLFPC